MSTKRAATAAAAAAARIDMESVSCIVSSQLSGFYHHLYPIYLNQNPAQTALTMQYKVLASLDGAAPKVVNPVAHGLRIVVFLRYGQTAHAVPEPQHQGLPLGPKRAVDIVSHTSVQGGAQSLSVRISSETLSTGGFESTVRLRVLVLHPIENVVLSFADSCRFVVMTRELPSPHRMVTYLRDWGFEIDSDDDETQKCWADMGGRKTSKKRKLDAPAAFTVDDEQDASPTTVSMPDGQFLFTLRGLGAVRQQFASVMPLSAGGGGADSGSIGLGGAGAGAGGSHGSFAAAAGVSSGAASVSSAIPVSRPTESRPARSSARKRRGSQLSEADEVEEAEKEEEVEGAAQFVASAAAASAVTAEAAGRRVSFAAAAASDAPRDGDQQVGQDAFSYFGDSDFLQHSCDSEFALSQVTAMASQLNAHEAALMVEALQRALHPCGLSSSTLPQPVGPSPLAASAGDRMLSFWASGASSPSCGNDVKASW
jgi:hypothetical protein